jgi:hypothetical protein
MDCSGQSLLAAIWGDMPEEMRSSLERHIRNALRVEGVSPLVQTDSATTAGGHKFSAIHFDYYAHNGTRVRLF